MANLIPLAVLLIKRVPEPAAPIAKFTSGSRVVLKSLISEQFACFMCEGEILSASIGIIGFLHELIKEVHARCHQLQAAQGNLAAVLDGDHTCRHPQKSPCTRVALITDS